MDNGVDGDGRGYGFVMVRENYDAGRRRGNAMQVDRARHALIPPSFSYAV